MRMRILLLEDDYALCTSIEEFLIEIGYSVDTFNNGNDAYDATYDNRYDIALLDVNVPGLNGFELLKTLRKENNNMPAIFMTSMTHVNSMEEGYDSGCCDYIRKPFDLNELELRLTYACKSFYYKNTNEVVLNEGLIYNLENNTLIHNNKEILLSKMEQDIFLVLLKRRNQVVSLSTFEDEIWGKYVDPANIRVQINNLRKKLPNSVIKNRRGLGYIIE